MCMCMCLYVYIYIVCAKDSMLEPTAAPNMNRNITNSTLGFVDRHDYRTLNLPFRAWI